MEMGRFMLSTIQHYQAPDMTLWQGRKDSLPGERFFQKVSPLDLSKEALPKVESGLAMIGFASDEGIRRNEGRIGAGNGPFVLREQLGKLACHQLRSFVDVGTIICHDQKLEEAHAELARVVAYCQEQGYKTVVLGGGHEVAWGHFRGLTSAYPKLGIINFDAHFDLRPVKEDNLSTSGTPFWQIAQHCKQQQLPFNYCCLGIQQLSNTQSLFSIANAYKVSYLTAAQINQNSFAWQTAFLDDFILSQEAVYLSVCLDVFAESMAPGVSAPQALGLLPWQVLPLLKYIMQTGKVVSIDIAELSPPLDREKQTSRLAAVILAQLLEFN